MMPGEKRMKIWPAQKTGKVKVKHGWKISKYFQSKVNNIANQTINAVIGTGSHIYQIRCSNSL
jgi:hypothetical protein